MPRNRSFLTVAVAGGLLTIAAGCASNPGDRSRADGDVDGEFAALQARGEVAMGVDQYTSTHVFDALPDGGRIEFQRDTDDPEGIAEIRRHLREIQAAFAEGDFATPAFVHAREVPGTEVMAARKDRIEYTYRDLPRGGELRLTTSDPAAIEAIRAFMAFQREDHRAVGADHSMDHATMDRLVPEHGITHHRGTYHGSIDHGGMDHPPTGSRAADHAGAGHAGMNHGGATGSGADQRAMSTTDHHRMLGNGDAAFAADMDIVHALLMNHEAITRTVVHLPNGIRTVTESASPAIARFLVEHVASMERRLAAGEVFNLFSHTIPTIFENYDRIHTEVEYGPTGVTLVQTSEDPMIVAALQAHAAEVTELVDEGMIAMMRGMMTANMASGMQGTMGGMGGLGGMPGAMSGMHGSMGVTHGAMGARDGMQGSMEGMRGHGAAAGGTPAPEESDRHGP
jgi:hypothetical protein